MSDVSRLSATERKILQCMAEGLSNNGISEHMHLSPKTVEFYTSSIFAKLDVLDHPHRNKRVQAVVAWLSHGPRPT